MPPGSGDCPWIEVFKIAISSCHYVSIGRNFVHRPSSELWRDNNCCVVHHTYYTNSICKSWCSTNAKANLFTKLDYIAEVKSSNIMKICARELTKERHIKRSRTYYTSFCYTSCVTYVKFWELLHFPSLWKTRKLYKYGFLINWFIKLFYTVLYNLPLPSCF